MHHTVGMSTALPMITSNKGFNMQTKSNESTAIATDLRSAELPASITPTVLIQVVGGTQYRADDSEIRRRAKMTQAERDETDRKWRDTFARLSPERKEEIR